jgi:hypothetical protein
MHIGKLHSRPSSSASNHYSAHSPAHLLPTRITSLSSKWPPLESPSPLLLVRKPMASYGVGFLPASIAVHVLGLVLLVLTLTWVISFRGGVSLFTSDSNQIFNVGSAYHSRKTGYVWQLFSPNMGQYGNRNHIL